MAEINWETLKVRHCKHAGGKVRLEVQKVYPAEFMPDQPARIVAHRCSHGMRCLITSKGACVWSGGNPGYDPFVESD